MPTKIAIIIGFLVGISAGFILFRNVNVYTPEYPDTREEVTSLKEEEIKLQAGINEYSKILRQDCINKKGNGDWTYSNTTNELTCE